MDCPWIWKEGQFTDYLAGLNVLKALRQATAWPVSESKLDKSAVAIRPETMWLSTSSSYEWKIIKFNDKQRSF